MIGLDTNVIIRYLTQDDPEQSRKANDLIEKRLSVKEPGFITVISLIEIVWVLESCYDQNKDSILAVLEALLGTKQFFIEKTEAVFIAKKRFSEGKADFSDALIAVISESEGCEEVFTFDKKALTIGMKLIK